MEDNLKNLAITEEEDDDLEFTDLGSNNDTKTMIYVLWEHFLNDILSYPNMEQTGLEIAEERKCRRGNFLRMGQKIKIACTNTKCMDMDTGIEACESSKATEITKAKGVENELVGDQAIEMLAGPGFRACPSQ
ncbi:hypothetical protein L6452_08633 [Arctium lappa]|uniref:Uncharacterized protein n=1 Tax=Arctium lappa TaxID=4217 RepID=A0ACB9DHU7_ARCLA|nr:hypothetical protein L6452_08633 [Arctium lappa]